jgi:hypothetical protein
VGAVAPKDVELYCFVPEWVTRYDSSVCLKMGDRNNLDNWRGIMLIDCLAKVLSVVVDRRLGRILCEEGLEE